MVEEVREVPMVHEVKQVRAVLQVHSVSSFRCVDLVVRHGEMQVGVLDVKKNES